MEPRTVNSRYDVRTRKPVLLLLGCATAGILFTMSGACNRVQQQDRQAAHEVRHTLRQTAQKISRGKDAVIDRVAPRYDSDEADTKANKKRFREHLNIEPTGDVENIYSYGEFLGADYKVLLAFTCDASTVRRIVRAQGMTPSATAPDEGLVFPDEFPWWNKVRIATLQPFKTGKDAAYWHYLWYDKAHRTAYYEEFSL